MEAIIMAKIPEKELMRRGTTHVQVVEQDTL